MAKVLSMEWTVFVIMIAIFQDKRAREIQMEQWKDEDMISEELPQTRNILKKSITKLKARKLEAFMRSKALFKTALYAWYTA